MSSTGSSVYSLTITDNTTGINSLTVSTTDYGNNVYDDASFLALAQAIVNAPNQPANSSVLVTKATPTYYNANADYTAFE